MGNGTGRKARLLGSRRVHGGQGRRQCIHRSVEHHGVRQEVRITRDKLANGALRHQLAQRCLSLTSNKIERRGNIGSRNRQRLQRQPSAHTARDIAGLERRIQRTLSFGKLARATAARKQHAPAANKHHGRIGQHHGVVPGT